MEITLRNLGIRLAQIYIKVIQRHGPKSYYFISFIFSKDGVFEVLNTVIIGPRYFSDIRMFAKILKRNYCDEKDEPTILGIYKMGYFTQLTLEDYWQQLDKQKKLDQLVGRI